MAAVWNSGGTPKGHDLTKSSTQPQITKSDQSQIHMGIKTNFSKIDKRVDAAIRHFLFLQKLNDAKFVSSQIDNYFNWTQKLGRKLTILKNVVSELQCQGMQESQPDKFTMIERTPSGLLTWAYGSKPNQTPTQSNQPVQQTQSTQSTQSTQTGKVKSKLFHHITNIDETKIPETTFQVVSTMNEIPPATYYYDGPHYRKGVYMRISDKMIVRLPMMDFMDISLNLSKVGTVRCKHLHKSRCEKYTYNGYGGKPRICKYAHSGDEFKRISSVARCQRLPRIGTRDSLISDLKYLQQSDIRTLLMGPLNDILIATIKLQSESRGIRSTRNLPPTVIDDIEICR
jgi:hypothetical protein